MYGTRDAPAIWASEVRRVFEAMGFQACKTDGCVYAHKEKDVVAVTHVDDFMLSGTRGHLEEVRQHIASDFEVKR